MPVTSNLLILEETNVLFLARVFRFRVVTVKNSRNRRVAWSQAFAIGTGIRPSVNDDS